MRSTYKHVATAMHVIKTFFAGLCLFSLGLLATSPTRAESDTGATLEKKVAGASDPRKNIWSVGIIGNRYYLKSANDDALIGNGSSVQLGTGRISKNWYAHWSLDIILGPYEPARGGQINTDFVGTGTTIWSGFSAQTLDLRSQAGGYGFALGLSYADVAGRSQGHNRLAKQCGTGPSLDENCQAENAKLVNSYLLRVTNLAIQPAIFFSWLAAARSQGNSPDLLATRIEGYFLTVGVAIPIVANYQAKFNTIGSAGEMTSSRGRLYGYSLVVGLTTMLGT